MLDPAFAEAVFHRWPRQIDRHDPWTAHRVLGHRLRPYSLWHALLLARGRSSLLAGNALASAGPMELVKAVEICRLRYPACEVKPRFSWRTFWHLLGGGLEHETRLFQAYLADFNTVPEYTVIPPKFCGDARTPAPEWLRIVRAIIACTGCSQAEAWNCPTGEARWWYALWIQERGADVDFLSATEKAAQTELERANPTLHAALVRGAQRSRQNHG